MKNKNWVKPWDIFVLEAKGGGVFHAVGPADAPPTLPEGGGGLRNYWLYQFLNHHKGPNHSVL